MNNPYNMQNMNASTTSMDLPPALASILNMGSATAPAPQPNYGIGLASGMGGAQSFVPSYQQGGMVGPDGMPMGGAPGAVGVSEGMVRGGSAQGGVMSPQMMEAQVNQFASQNPQQINGLRVAIQQVMQTGELTQPELNTIIQLATVAAQNPEMYPYVRKFAIQNGITTEQDLPEQYDQGLIFVLLLAARAIQADLGGQNMMQGGSPTMAGGPQVSMSQVASGPIPSMARGGSVPGGASPGKSSPILIQAHTGEYVIPKNVVDMKGREFFDSLVEKYKGR